MEIKGNLSTFPGNEQILEAIDAINQWKLGVDKPEKVKEAKSTLDKISKTTTDVWGNNMAHWAAKEGNIPALKYLLLQGAELNIPNNAGELPFDAKDDKGNTMVHKSAKEGNIPALKYLLSQGAELNIPNNAGELPVDLAVIGGNKELGCFTTTALLCAHGGEFNDNNVELYFLLKPEGKEENWLPRDLINLDGNSSDDLTLLGSGHSYNYDSIKFLSGGFNNLDHLACVENLGW